MRFERLDLVRYGHFTDYSIEFGTPSGKGDFHLIYGPNEAGKSTLRDACIDFLFGFERVTSYNFKHPNASLLIGAEISANGKSISAQRIKRDSNDFQNRAGEPLLDTELRAALGNVSRASYMQMFSLDENTLVDGGNEILKSQGDLGALLFSAASGLSSISESLDQIQQQASSFFKPSGRKFRLNEYKDQLKHLKEQLREIDLQATAYDRLRKQANSAEQHHREAKSVHEEKSARLQELGALIQAAESYADYKEVLNRLEDLNDAPDLADGFREEAEQLARDSAANKGLLSESQQALKRSQEACEEITLDAKMLENAAAIHRLSEGEIEARYKTSSDIDHRQRDIASCENEVRTILQKLGQANCDDPRLLLLSAATLGIARELLDQRTGLRVDKKNAAAELDHADDARREAQKECEKYSELKDLSDVASHLDQLGSIVDPEILKTKLAHIESMHQEMAKSVEALKPWKGDPAKLIQIDIPDKSVLQKLSYESEELRETQKRHMSEIAQLETDTASHSAIINSLLSTSDLIDDEQANSIKAARSDAWAKHIGEFKNSDVPSSERLRETALYFEAAMMDDDNSSRLRLSQSTELARLKQVQLDLAKSDARLQVAQKHSTKIAASLAETNDQVSEIMIAIGLPQSTDLEFLTHWLEKRDYAFRRIIEFSIQKADFDAYEKQRLDALSMLQNSMRDTGIFSSSKTNQSENLQALIGLGQKAVSDWRNDVLLRDRAGQSHNDANAELKRRQKYSDHVHAQQAEWDANWISALSGTWMASTKPDEVKYFLQLLEDMDGRFTDIDKLEERIEAMRFNRSVYIKEVGRLAAVVGLGSRLIQIQ